jgi:predicted TIM-barrel fold metal-dependent hydrolase
LPAAGAAARSQPIDVVSADDHWAVTEDIFFEQFPAHLKARAPRIWHQGYWRIGQPGIKEAWAQGAVIENAILKANLQDGWDHGKRSAHLEAEGISKEIVYPQSLLGYVEPDPEAREWIFRIYNEYIADQQRRNESFFGVGLCSNWWDAGKVDKAVDQIVSLGLKSVLVPLALRDGENKDMSYADPVMDRLWSAVCDAKLPVCFHIGEPFSVSGRGAMATVTLVAMAPFRRPLSQLVFGGVFDRHPSLKVVFAEGGISWVLAWLQDAEAIYDTYDTIIEPIAHRPSHYWREHCHATFMSDALGLSRLDILGADRVMWAADYPHTEGTFGVSRQRAGSIVEQIGAEKAQQVLGGNARRVFAI